MERRDDKTHLYFLVRRAAIAGGFRITLIYAVKLKKILSGISAIRSKGLLRVLLIIEIRNQGKASAA